MGVGRGLDFNEAGGRTPWENFTSKGHLDLDYKCTKNANESTHIQQC